MSDISGIWRFCFNMTISGLLFAIYGWYNVWISHNLFYSLDLGIIIGFAMQNFGS